VKNVKVVLESKTNIFLRAKLNKAKGMGYRAYNQHTLWQSKKCSWNRIFIIYGIRWSDIYQVLPVWNTSNNCQRSLLFGFWKLYLELGYYRAGSFNQDRKLFMRKKLWRFYQLIC